MLSHCKCAFGVAVDDKLKEAGFAYGGAFVPQSIAFVVDILIHNLSSFSKTDFSMIWASHGKDEDYTFGYTEEELEDAL